MNNSIPINRNEEYTSIPLSLIKVEENVRKQYSPDDKSIEELATSLKTYGQLPPIRVYETASNGYAILFGHRRYYAAKKAGIEELKCIICDNPATTDRLYTRELAVTVHTFSASVAFCKLRPLLGNRILTCTKSH